MQLFVQLFLLEFVWDFSFCPSLESIFSSFYQCGVKEWSDVILLFHGATPTSWSATGDLDVAQTLGPDSAHSPVATGGQVLGSSSAVPYASLVPSTGAPADCRHISVFMGCPMLSVTCLLLRTH